MATINDVAKHRMEEEAMTRINVYTSDPYEGKTLAGWFDPDKAEIREEENTQGNMVGIHSGVHKHEALYRTAGGRWVLHRWSDYRDSEPTYEFITDDQAKKWLIIDESDSANQLIERYFGELEEERGPGRPEIGGRVNLRLGDALVAALDARAKSEGINRAELARRLLTDALGR